MKKQFILSLFALLALVSCDDKDGDAAAPELAGQTTVTFDAVAGSQDFQLNQDLTISGRTFNFTQLRYWVSNVELTNEKGEAYQVPEAYYLLEETNEQSVQDGRFTYTARKREDVVLTSIPAGTYKAITFSVGIDPAYNDNLSKQAGELSVMNGMSNISWMWHTSYIFSSMKGKVSESGTSQDLKVETGLNANYRTVTLQLPSPIRIGSLKDTNIQLKMDVAKVLDGLDLAVTPTVNAATPQAMTLVADNFKNKAFTVVSVQ